MIGIRFVKAPPTTYILHYKNGKIVRQGAGLSFFYYAPTSSLVAVPMASTDVPFVFSEITGDFQAITLQGQLSYRISEPARLAALLDYSVDADLGYLSDDPDLLSQRLVQEAQVHSRTITQNMRLREALIGSDSIAARALEALQKSDSIKRLGVEILGLSMLQAKPVPEMSRALEAEAREELQKRADEAIYARRNSAVEQERRIKESELNTEIAVEEKKRKIRETKMAAEIAVEEQRATLINQQVENDKKLADSKGYALEASIKPLRDIDWKKLLAMSNGGSDPKLMIALAFREMAENAQKIGELNMSPDLLKSLMAKG
jgi:regulator of protease activity HflC (stomatin/prohibitin superfamily)